MLSSTILTRKSREEKLQCRNLVLLDYKRKATLGFYTLLPFPTVVPLSLGLNKGFYIAKVISRVLCKGLLRFWMYYGSITHRKGASSIMLHDKKFCLNIGFFQKSGVKRSKPLVHLSISVTPLHLAQ